MKLPFPAPPKPTGSGPFWTFMKWVWDMLNIPFVDSSTVKWNVTSRGVSARVVGVGGSGGSSSPLNVQRFVLLDPAANPSAIQSEYVLAYKFGDVNRIAVQIIKPFKLRGSIANATIDGQLWTYTYPNAPFTWNRRNGTTIINGVQKVELQVIVPRFLNGDELWAVQLPDGWHDLNLDARAWSAKVDQTSG